MTESQKTEVTRLKLQGVKNKEIAIRTGLSLSAITSFWHRHKPAEDDASIRICKFCGEVYDASVYRRRKEFCSESCYYKWWLKQNGGRKRTTYHAKCRSCGKSFISIVKRQKFCSASCYHDSRRKDARHET